MRPHVSLYGGSRKLGMGLHEQQNIGLSYNNVYDGWSSESDRDTILEKCEQYYNVTDRVTPSENIQSPWRKQGNGRRRHRARREARSIVEAGKSIWANPKCALYHMHQDNLQWCWFQKVLAPSESRKMRFSFMKLTYQRTQDCLDQKTSCGMMTWAILGSLVWAS